MKCKNRANHGNTAENFFAAPDITIRKHFVSAGQGGLPEIFAQVSRPFQFKTHRAFRMTPGGGFAVVVLDGRGFL